MVAQTGSQVPALGTDPLHHSPPVTKYVHLGWGSEFFVSQINTKRCAPHGQSTWMKRDIKDKICSVCDEVIPPGAAGGIAEGRDVWRSLTT